jgi:hypothetical protein
MSGLPLKSLWTGPAILPHPDPEQPAPGIPPVPEPGVPASERSPPKPRRADPRESLRSQTRSGQRNTYTNSLPIKGDQRCG